MARNEADIIGRTVGHLRRQGVTTIVVADNLSTDNTAAEALKAGAEVVFDDEPAYRQAEKMTALAARYALPGEWVVPFDADEYWWNLAELTEDTPYDLVTARPHVHVTGERRALVNEPQPKVAFRWREGVSIAMGNHWAEGVGDRVAIGWLDVCHYQYRSLTQVRRKVRQGVEAVGPLHERYCSHWRELAAKSDDELAEWWASYLDQATVPCPRLPR